MEATDALLDQVVEVCPLPATTQRVLALTSNDSSGIPEVSRVISTDPALATSVLRVANSAAYGMGRVDRLEQAVLRLGLRELHNLAAAMALFAAFRNKAEHKLQLHELCVTSGSVAHRLAKETKLEVPSTAFTCGLLSEIGAMACLVFDGKDYVALWQAANGNPDLRAQLEQERYGATSFAIGQRFLQRNSLPDNICTAVGADLSQIQPDAEALAKLTLFARHVPPLALLLNKDIPALRQRLDELAERVALQQVDGTRLLEAWTRMAPSEAFS